MLWIALFLVVLARSSVLKARDYNSTRFRSVALEAQYHDYTQHYSAPHFAAIATTMEDNVDNNLLIDNLNDDIIEWDDGSAFQGCLVSKEYPKDGH